MLTTFLWTTCLALNILDTLKALKRPRPNRRKSSTTARVRFEDDSQGPGEGDGWQPVKRLSPVKREYWRGLLQNWVAWAAFVYVEPYLDRFGIVVPFYGWFKVLFLAYLCLTRPSGGAVIYQSLIAPRLQKHARTIDLSASFVLLLGECIAQLGLMVAVLPFVGVWEALRRAWSTVRALSLRGLFRRKRKEEKAAEIEDVVENLTVNADDDVKIRVTISSPSIRTTSDSQQASSSMNEVNQPSTPTPASTAAPSNRRTSLLPTSQEITAYTLSSPQTLRRAVHQAREIFSDSQRRDAGKKRGDVDLGKGMMKRRVLELEEKRKAAVARKAAKSVTPVAAVQPSSSTAQASSSSSMAAESSTAGHARPTKPAKPVTEKRPAGAVPLAARATAKRGRTRLVGNRAGPSTANSTQPAASTSAAGSSSSQTASPGEGSGSAGPSVAQGRPPSAARGMSARDSLLTRNASSAQGQPSRDLSSTTPSSSAAPTPASAPAPAKRTVSQLTRDARTLSSSRPIPPGYVSWPGEPPAPGLPSYGYPAGARYVARDGSRLDTFPARPAAGGQIMPEARNVPSQPAPGPRTVQPVPGVQSVQPGQTVPSVLSLQPPQMARSSAAEAVRPNGSVPVARRTLAIPPLTTRPLSRESAVASGSTAAQSRLPARQEVAPKPIESAQHVQPVPVVRPGQPVQSVSSAPNVQPVQSVPPTQPTQPTQAVQPVSNAQSAQAAQPVVQAIGKYATTPIARDPPTREDVAASGSSSTTQATTSTTAVENLNSAITPAKPVQETSHLSPVIAELEPPTSGSTFGLGFGDVGTTASTSRTDTETSTRRVVPGGYPAAFTASPISALNPLEGASHATTRVTGYTRPSSVPSAVRPPSPKPMETPPPSASTSAGLDRPALRKNNSLGLVTTLESMRSPSMEPTSSFAHTGVGSFESRHSPFFGQQTAFPSRLREQAAEPVVTTTIRTSHQALSTVQSSDAQPSRGVFIPVMPLPDMTPAASPVAQRHVSFVAPAQTEKPIAETEKSSADVTPTKASFEEEAVAPVEEQDEPIPPLSAVSEALEVATSPRRPQWQSLSDAEDASPLTSIASLDDEDDDDLPGPSTKMLRLMERPEAERRATRAMRPVITKPLGRREERLFRKTARASRGATAAESSVDNATSPETQLTRRELPTRSTVREPNGVRTRTASMPTSADEGITPGKASNERKRKEPPQASAPTQARAIPTANSRLAAQRAVRPVLPSRTGLPASVHTRTEFALPETLIADVTPVRRTRSTAELDGAYQPRESPTKKRKVRGGDAVAAVSSMEPETSGTQERRRSRRMQPRESA